MASIATTVRRLLSGRGRADHSARGRRTVPVEPVDAVIGHGDPLLALLQQSSGAVDLETLDLDSPALAALKADGVRLVVPLVSRGELVGMLNLGSRLSDHDYSADDRRLLERIAAQAAPAVRVAQVIHQQEAEVRSRERLEQELRVAQLIQQQFLPKDLAHVPGWQISAYYQPARAVGGDFYDFIELPEGRIGIVVGDVSDKGVPAALVMATTHSILRSDAPRLVSPGEVLRRANELLVSDIPAQMFVTCLYAVLDPATGHLRFANAGHNFPYLHRADGTVEALRATGMPLGLMSGMPYEESETELDPGSVMLLLSDGLVEAHDPSGEMFGFPRVTEIMAHQQDHALVIDELLKELSRHTGPTWEQEDDITLVALRRSVTRPATTGGDGQAGPRIERELAHFSLPSESGREREAAAKVIESLRDLDVEPARLEKIRTAVAEATMNAIEHGNRHDPDAPVDIRVTLDGDRLSIFVTDRGGDVPLPEVEEPDLEAKLAGLQSPRGWGLFLIRNMVDDVQTSSEGPYHTLKLVVRVSDGGASERVE